MGSAVVSTGGGSRCSSKSPRLRRKTRPHGSSSHSSAGASCAETSRSGWATVPSDIVLCRGVSNRIIAEMHGPVLALRHFLKLLGNPAPACNDVHHGKGHGSEISGSAGSRGLALDLCGGSPA